MNDKQPTPGPSREQLREAAANPQLNQDMALALLARRDLPQAAVEALAANRAVMKHRRVALEVVKHPRAPRHLVLPLLRRLYTFELMQVALTPAVAADLKFAAEEILIARLETVSAGERLTLARRGSTRLAAALLLDPDDRVVAAALENPYLTEVCVAKALMNEAAPAGLADVVSRHPNWSLRSDVQLALLECGKLAWPRIQALLRWLPQRLLQTALQAARLPALVRAAILEELKARPDEQDAAGRATSDNR